MWRDGLEKEEEATDGATDEATDEAQGGRRKVARSGIVLSCFDPPVAKCGNLAVMQSEKFVERSSASTFSF